MARKSHVWRPRNHSGRAVSDGVGNLSDTTAKRAEQLASKFVESIFDSLERQIPEAADEFITRAINQTSVSQPETQSEEANAEPPAKESKEQLKQFNSNKKEKSK